MLCRNPDCSEVILVNSNDSHWDLVSGYVERCDICLMVMWEKLTTPSISTSLKSQT